MILYEEEESYLFLLYYVYNDNFHPTETQNKCCDENPTNTYILISRRNFFMEKYLV